MTDTLTQTPPKSWLAPLVLALAAWPAGWAGGQGLFKIVAFIAHEQGCEVCLRPTDAAPTIWSLTVGIMLLALAGAWLILLGRTVFVALRRRTHSLAHVTLALALLGLFAWASR
ncbi:hypothetical protein ASD79_03855 [Caulobacter sp. Root655]|nr:hypothetical protein ASD79_03855 [Caulobacter sp. Root655]